jgi:hypothetical protein
VNQIIPWKQAVKEITEQLNAAAAKLPPEDREAFLRAACSWLSGGIVGVKRK